MHSVENWERNELAILLFLGSWSPRGKLLPNPLMGPSPFQVLHIFANHPIELLFPQDQDVIEAFCSHTDQELFTECIRFGLTVRGFQNFYRRPYNNACKGFPILTVAIPNQKARRLTKSGCLAQLLSHPSIRW